MGELSPSPGGEQPIQSRLPRKAWKGLGRTAGVGEQSQRTEKEQTGGAGKEEGENPGGVVPVTVVNKPSMSVGPGGLSSPSCPCASVRVYRVEGRARLADGE